MRNLRVVRGFALAAVLVIALGAGASAGPVTGTLSILVGGLPPIGVSASGTGASSASSVTLDGSVFVASGATFAVTTPIFTKVILTAANGPGVFQGSPLGGPMKVGGRVRVLRGGVTAFSVPLTASGTRGVGLGGSPVQTGTSASLFTLVGGEWTTGWATVTGVGAPGSPRTVALQGSDARTANGAGTLTLVTPIRIAHTSLGGIAAFGVLRLTFAPEPSAVALLAAASGLLAFGARRLRSRR